MSRTGRARDPLGYAVRFPLCGLVSIQRRYHADARRHAGEGRHVLDMRSRKPAPQLAVIDCETTGLGRHDRIVEIAVLTLDPDSWETLDEYDTLINPERDVGPVELHGITASMVEAAPTFAQVAAPLARRLHGAVLIAHNISFDARMLRYEFTRLHVEFGAVSGRCTLRATREKLGAACRRHGIALENAHRALADARSTAALGRKVLTDEERNAAAAAGFTHGALSVKSSSGRLFCSWVRCCDPSITKSQSSARPSVITSTEC